MNRIREYFYGPASDLCPQLTVVDFKDINIYKVGGGNRIYLSISSILLFPIPHSYFLIYTYLLNDITRSSSPSIRITHWNPIYCRSHTIDWNTTNCWYRSQVLIVFWFFFKIIYYSYLISYSCMYIVIVWWEYVMRNRLITC